MPHVRFVFIYLFIETRGTTRFTLKWDVPLNHIEAMNAMLKSLRVAQTVVVH